MCIHRTDKTPCSRPSNANWGCVAFFLFLLCSIFPERSLAQGKESWCINAWNRDWTGLEAQSIWARETVPAISKLRDFYTIGLEGDGGLQVSWIGRNYVPDSLFLMGKIPVFTGDTMELVNQPLISSWMSVASGRSGHFGGREVWSLDIGLENGKDTLIFLFPERRGDSLYLTGLWEAPHSAGFRKGKHFSDGKHASKVMDEWSFMLMASPGLRVALEVNGRSLGQAKRRATKVLWSMEMRGIAKGRFDVHCISGNSKLDRFRFKAL